MKPETTALVESLKAGGIEKPKNTRQWLQKYTPEFAKALGSSMDAERFTRILITKVMSNEKLSQVAAANPISLVGACLEIAQKRLDPSISNEVFLIPYGNSIIAQDGYKGLQKMALRCARYRILAASCIYENDFYDRALGSETKVTHRPPPFGQERGTLIGFVAVAVDENGGTYFEEMTLAQAKKHFDRYCKSKNNKASPWSDPENFPAYGLKTVMRLLITRHLPMSAELTDSLKREESIETSTVEMPEDSDSTTNEPKMEETCEHS